jgi:ubiquinone/menaquinone biosynthesis C-methylase UbiE
MSTARPLVDILDDRNGEWRIICRILPGWIGQMNLAAKEWVEEFFRRARSAVSVVRRLQHNSSKHDAEMAFWRDRYQESKGKLKNSHYKYFYTSYFKIDQEEYSGRSILDIGCGPRGSLEWANNAKQRVGLDPLVKRYQKLGIGAHRMTYVCAPSELIPFPNEHFDFVASFNSLDHVDDVDKTLSEITRVLKKSGCFLLITEINHPPTPTEPQILTEELVGRLSREYTHVSVNFVAIRSDHDIYSSLHENVPYIPSFGVPGLLCAHLIKRAATVSLAAAAASLL